MKNSEQTQSGVTQKIRLRFTSMMKSCDLRDRATSSAARRSDPRT
jgi:hypothetical protein